MEGLTYDELKELSKPYDDELIRYESCMREIRKRLLILTLNLEQGTTPNRIIFDTEFACLQIRFIIELIMLANLAANKKLYKQGERKMRNEWRAHKILDFLLNTNPDFYPKPVQINMSSFSQTPIILDMNPIETGYLTKEEIVSIHNSCSNYLHGHNPFKPAKDYEIRMNFPIWIEKIHKLITTHIIKLANQNAFILTIFDWTNPSKRDIYTLYLNVEKMEVLS